MKHANMYQESIAKLAATSRLILTAGDKFHYEEYMLPFREIRRDDPLRIFSITHHSLRRAAVETLKDFGLGSTTSILVKSSRVYLLADTEYVVFLERFYKEHFGIELRFLR